MSYDNPAHRPVLEAEGLKRWVKPQLDGYASLGAAAGRQGFFERQTALKRSASGGRSLVTRS